jgi:peroxidase
MYLATEYRTLDGSNNNLVFPNWGAIGQPFARRFYNDYTDGRSEPNHLNRPTARVLSNTLTRRTDFTLQDRSLLNIGFGQFITHDVSQSFTDGPSDNIPIPPDDLFFKAKWINLTRSAFITQNNVRY